jgi:hypothetical protein
VRNNKKQKELRKQDQSGILAQKFLLCGKLRLEVFRESLFRTLTRALSSGAMVTAAKSVQRGFPAMRKKEDECCNVKRKNLEPRRARRITKEFVSGFRSGHFVSFMVVAPDPSAPNRGLEVMAGVIYTYGLP